MHGELLSSRDVDSSGISSSAAVGVACLLALEAVNDLSVSALENIELDRCALHMPLLMLPFIYTGHLAACRRRAHDAIICCRCLAGSSKTSTSA